MAENKQDVKINIGGQQLGAIDAIVALMLEVVRQNNQLQSNYDETIRKIGDVQTALNNLAGRILTIEGANDLYRRGRNLDRKDTREILQALGTLSNSQNNAGETISGDQLAQLINNTDEILRVVNSGVNTNTSTNATISASTNATTSENVSNLINLLNNVISNINRGLNTNRTTETSTNAGQENGSATETPITPNATPNETSTATPNSNPTTNTVSGNEQSDTNPEGTTPAEPANSTEGTGNATSDTTTGATGALAGSGSDAPTSGEPTGTPTSGATSDNPTNDTVDNPTSGEPTGTPEGDNPKRKLKKVKLVRKAMDETRMLAEPKLPWYKKMFKFANNHPVLATLVGGAIGLGLTALSGPIFYMYMGLGGMLNAFGITLGSGAVLGLGAGALASGLSNRVLKGKKGRLYSKFGRLYNKCASIEKQNANLEHMAETSMQRAQEYQKKADKSKGIFKSIRRFGYRKVRNLNLKAAGLTKVLWAKNKTRFNNKVDEALQTKVELNRREATPNRRGKTKTLAIAGYLQKKKNLDNKLSKGKISLEEYNVRLHDLDIDSSELKGGAPISTVHPNHRTYDKEAYNLIKAVQGRKSDTMQAVMQDISNRYGETEQSEEYYLDPEVAQSEIERLMAEGKEDDAKAIEQALKAQQRAIEEHRNITGEEPQVYDVEENASESESANSEHSR